MSSRGTPVPSPHRDAPVVPGTRAGYLTDRRFLPAAYGVAIAVAAVIAVLASGVLPPAAATVLDGVVQVSTSGAAAGVCLATARHRQGMERRWRLLMGVALTVYTMATAVWAWARGATAVPFAPPWLADIGFLAFPAIALPALLAFASVNTRDAEERGSPARTAAHTYAVLLLDGLIVAGSLFLLAWAMVLHVVVQTGGLTRSVFAITILYPLTDLVLVTIVLLLASFRRVRQPRQLSLLGLALVAFTVSDSVYAYLVSSGARTMDLVVSAGWIVFPVLIALAALTDDEPPLEDLGPGQAGAFAWGHLLVPYLPLVLAGFVIAMQSAGGRPVGTVELFSGAVILGLVVLRQFLTLADNTALLCRVRQGQERLLYQALHDPLTGLANQRLFYERLAEAVELLRSEGRPFGVLYIDLDDFKAINDDLGHYAGDALLRAVGGRLRGCVDAVDSVSRLGGDEFAVLLDCDKATADRIRERVAETLRRPFAVAGRLRTVQASIGVVVPGATDADLSPEMLLRRADAAMYSAKRKRKQESRGADRRGVDLRDELAAALRGPGHPGLDVYYQPIVRIADRGLVAVEALARWTSPTVGVVSPDVFVALAEQNGLVADLDNLVLDRACRDLVAAPMPPLALHVNVSATRLDDTALVDQVCAALDRHGLPGERLVLEITETGQVPDFDVAAAVIDRLHRSGVQIALDDFGAGYNTLAHLHRFPVDIVKVDQTFATCHDLDGSHTYALRQSILSIARALDVMIVIEGVETEEQAAEVAQQGYDLAQGHLYGRPAPIDRLRASVAASTDDRAREPSA